MVKQKKEVKINKLKLYYFFVNKGINFELSYLVIIF